MKTVTSVLGELKPEDLGTVLTHEHFNLNFQQFYREPPSTVKKYLGSKITLDTVGYLKQYPYGSQTNVQFYGEEVDRAVLDEMKRYKELGGGTIVENTNHGLARNLDLAYDVAKTTGVNVIVGTGFYVEAVQHASTLNKSVEEMCEVMRQDLHDGQSVSSSPTAIKCGIIGEVGSTWPITDFEKRAIASAAIVQSEEGCAVSFHPGRHRDAPFEILRLYAEAGGNMAKADMSHLDRTIPNVEDLLEFARIGSYCQFDLFGNEVSYYMLAPESDMPSDAQRIDRIKALLDAGYNDKILLSHDIHTKHRLAEFGGHGYSHLITNVRLHMKVKGVSDEDVNKMFVRNPANWLCY